jgi:glutamine synthetase
MSYKLTTPEDVLKVIKDDKIAMVDLRFTDLPGPWQHFSVPPSALDLDSFEDGVGFDGSSIRGFQETQKSDMLVIPDPASAFLDPFTEMPTLVLICTIRDPVVAGRQTTVSNCSGPLLAGSGAVSKPRIMPKWQILTTWISWRGRDALPRHRG